ncbi:hypothetical protein SLS56_008743 [Neofusicoccum ribis]|uniref:BTB domain-containing protein n=1 Tax=Neofusicoccum ribis TaxID=45134 RepID=A0ABR3SJD1_9PEZI
MAKETPTKATPPTPTKPPDDGVRKRSRVGSGVKSRMVQVKVGGREEPYHVHKDVLCASSPFFRKACNGPWKESRKNWIDLPKDHPKVFEVYLQWLYLDDFDIPASEGFKHPSFWTIYESYKFGDKILDISFKNAVIDVLVDVNIKYRRYPAFLANRIYDELPSSSTFRRLYVDFWIWSEGTSQYGDGRKGSDSETAPMEFFRDVAKGLAQLKTSGFKADARKPWISDTCQYHEHTEDESKAIPPAHPERDSGSSKEGSKDRVSKAAALGTSSLKSKTISVAVGGQTEPFLIHQDILCASSPFFRNACNGGWKESEEGFVTLPCHSPEAFEVYTQWLYSGKMFVDEHKDDYESMDWDIFIGAYLLGDKLLDVDFRNTLIDLAIRIEVYYGIIPHNHAKAAYSGLPVSDPYRRLYVDMHTWEIASSWYSDVNNKNATDAPTEVFRDVAKTAAENRRSIGSLEDGPWVTDPGRYHHKHPSS